mmetsp:Transcript_24069/g.42498  ORF Transcript_24069/g.42498 Transcript_24069/m.42498 type:complete len:168 (-) Transcript_24069:139-642(-)
MAAFKSTADLCDEFLDDVRYVDDLGWRDFGGKIRFAGVAATVSCMEDNSMVKETSKQPGEGRILVVHAGGCRSRAFMGDQMAERALANGWSGFVINGCVRDAADLAKMEIGIKALGAHPRKTENRGDGKSQVPVSFGGAVISPGDFIVCDEDGIVVGTQEQLSAKFK